MPGICIQSCINACKLCVLQRHQVHLHMRNACDTRFLVHWPVTTGGNIYPSGAASSAGAHSRMRGAGERRGVNFSGDPNAAQINPHPCAMFCHLRQWGGGGGCDPATSWHFQTKRCKVSRKNSRLLSPSTCGLLNRFLLLNHYLTYNSRENFREHPCFSTLLPFISVCVRHAT